MKVAPRFAERQNGVCYDLNKEMSRKMTKRVKSSSRLLIKKPAEAQLHVFIDHFASELLVCVHQHDDRYTIPPRLLDLVPNVRDQTQKNGV